jgi:bifunctional non-homologous end joining protein LigD
MLINVDNYTVKITNSEKLLWPNLNIKKIDYIKFITLLSQYIIPYTKDRLLTTIRYPDGVNGKFFYQKQIPNYAPEWIDTLKYKNNTYINLNKRATLIWLANQAALEFHVSFNKYTEELYPTSLVFDLDPSTGQTFNDVVEVAIRIHETLINLNINSYVKTSGATGLQIYIPIGNKYDYNTARNISLFFAKYFCEKHPNLITIERLKNKRATKLYFDYLQMWHGKTIISPYSPRATEPASISMPLKWEELNNNIKPSDFTLVNCLERLNQYGDLFEPTLVKNNSQNLDFLLQYVTV